MCHFYHDGCRCVLDDDDGDDDDDSNNNDDNNVFTVYNFIDN